MRHMTSDEEDRCQAAAEMLLGSLVETMVSWQLSILQEDGHESDLSIDWADRIWDLMIKADPDVVNRALFLALDGVVTKRVRESVRWLKALTE